MNIVIALLIIIIWPASFLFVEGFIEDEMKKKNIPIRIEDTLLQGKVQMFILSPLFSLWILWVELKFALISLFVCLPHLGKKNDLSKEDLERMADEYLKEKEDER
jgi:hypothetical protein